MGGSVTRCASTAGSTWCFGENDNVDRFNYHMACLMHIFCLAALSHEDIDPTANSGGCRPRICCTICKQSNIADMLCGRRNAQCTGLGTSSRSARNDQKPVSTCEDRTLPAPRIQEIMTPVLSLFPGFLSVRLRPVFPRRQWCYKLPRLARLLRQHACNYVSKSTTPCVCRLIDMSVFNLPLRLCAALRPWRVGS